MKKCQKCGSVVPDQMSYCAVCGSKVQPAESQAQTPTVSAPQSGSSTVQIMDLFGLGCAVASILMFKFYIGIAFGAAAVYLGYKQIKTAKSSPKKILGIIAVAAGALGVMAGIGLVFLKK